MKTAETTSKLVLLTGATGYVGGRLRVALEQGGHAVRCLARRPEHLLGRVGPQTEVVGGDLLDAQSLTTALDGVHTAYYLVHAMGSGRSFEQIDRQCAQLFGEACQQAGVQRIIYLGGLGSQGERLSAHLRSRHEVGAILGRSGVHTVEPRASIVIGSGSLSFEMVSGLVERLPVMLTPRWVRVKAQPIAVEDLIAYLVASLDVEVGGHCILEIGGSDQSSYGELMREYARQRGLRRWMVPVPLLTPALSRHWLGLVTPLYARVGKHLVDSIRHSTVVTDPAARELFDIEPMSTRQAIARALANEDREIAQSRWNDAESATTDGGLWRSEAQGSRLVDRRERAVDVSPERAFIPIRRIGGERGWYFANLLWQLRSLLDVLFGGPGLRRGRRDPEQLQAGDVVDFWRVEHVEPDRLLRLRAEMKVPGRAWLQLEVYPGPKGRGAVIRQTALFDPAGLLGRLYWYAIYPVHVLVFAGMIRGLARQAHRPSQAPALPVGRLGPLTLWLGLCWLAAALGGVFTAMSVSDWLPSLAAPSWNPPGWVFGPVWTLLYGLMAVAAWRVWTRRRLAPARGALILFGVQLLLNVGWSAVFFGLREPGWAVLEIGVLWASISATLLLFWRVDRTSGLLLVPYLAWVSFAAALNVAFWRLNS